MLSEEVPKEPKEGKTRKGGRRPEFASTFWCVFSVARAPLVMRKEIYKHADGCILRPRISTCRFGRGSHDVPKSCPFHDHDVVTKLRG
jgi:hypothetical protein